MSKSKKIGDYSDIVDSNKDNDKNLCIMKQNPLIFAEFSNAFGGMDRDVLNVLLYVLQSHLIIEEKNINLFNYQAIFSRTIRIRASLFKKKAKLGINANSDIFASLKKIRDTSAIIKNFIDIDNTKVRAKTVSIIDSVKWIDENATHDGREHAFEIQFNEWFLKVSTREFNSKVGNYTTVNLEDTASFNSAFAKVLYEILKSKQHRGIGFSLTLVEMRNIFNMQKRQLSHFVNIITRVQPEVTKFISFEVKVFKADKLISFIFN